MNPSALPPLPVDDDDASAPSAVSADSEGSDVLTDGTIDLEAEMVRHNGDQPRLGPTRAGGGDSYRVDGHISFAEAIPMLGYWAP